MNRGNKGPVPGSHNRLPDNGFWLMANDRRIQCSWTSPDRLPGCAAVAVPPSPPPLASRTNQRFFIALLNDGTYEGGRILDRESVDEMLRFQYSAANKPDNVKLSGEGSVNAGIFWATKEALTRIGHNGADPGLVTMMLSDVDKQIGVIMFVTPRYARRTERPTEPSSMNFGNLARI